MSRRWRLREYRFRTWDEWVRCLPRLAWRRKGFIETFTFATDTTPAVVRVSETEQLLVGLPRWLAAPTGRTVEEPSPGIHPVYGPSRLSDALAYADLLFDTERASRARFTRELTEACGLQPRDSERPFHDPDLGELHGS